MEPSSIGAFRDALRTVAGSIPNRPDLSAVIDLWRFLAGPGNVSQGCRLQEDQQW